jgi:hypothetical protein
MRGFPPVTVSLILGLLLGGCALFTIDQRTTEGPTAEGIWKARFQAAQGRSPSFVEKQTFEEEMEARVRDFLWNNPEVANSLRVGNLRLFRQVTVGMTKGEITLLLGKPQDVTDAPARMEALARQFWPAVKAHAKEAWLYPAGWTLYFDGDALTDITRYHRAFLRE